MDERDLARYLGALRAAIGAGLLVAPGFAGRVWVGPDADGDGTKVFARTLGARDLLLGLRTLDAVRDKEPVRGWLRLGVLADGADAVATILAARQLTRARKVLMPAIAAGAAVLGYKAASAAD